MLNERYSKSNILEQQCSETVKVGSDKTKCLKYNSCRIIMDYQECHGIEYIFHLALLQHFAACKINIAYSHFFLTLKIYFT